MASHNRLECLETGWGTLERSTMRRCTNPRTPVWPRPASILGRRSRYSSGLRNRKFVKTANPKLLKNTYPEPKPRRTKGTASGTLSSGEKTKSTPKDNSNASKSAQRNSAAEPSRRCRQKKL
ncbi:MAG: hypothetical protein ACQCN4_11425 [Candidatus Bathyarchaeia archaeon]